MKLHTHGALEVNANMLLGEPMRQFHTSLASFAAEHDWFHYYYVTARQMAALVHLIERCEAGESPAPALVALQEKPLAKPPGRAAIA